MLRDIKSLISLQLWVFLVPCETHHPEIIPVHAVLKLGFPQPGRKAQAGEMEITIATPERATSAREVGRGELLQGSYLKRRT